MRVFFSAILYSMWVVSLYSQPPLLACAVCYTSFIMCLLIPNVHAFQGLWQHEYNKPLHIPTIPSV